MKYSILALATLLIIEIGLSNAAVKEDGVDERKPLDFKKAKNDTDVTQDYGRSQKRNPSKIDSKDEVIKTAEKEVKKSSPKRQAPRGTKTIPKQKATPKKAPTPKMVAARQEEVYDAADDKLKNEINEKPMLPSQKDQTNSIGLSDVLQQFTLQMKNLSSTMENLQLLLRNKMLKVFGSVSNPEPAVFNNNINLTPVAPISVDFAATSLTSCRMNDDNFEECLKGYLRNAIKYSQGGNPKFSIPPLDPYYFPHKVEVKILNQALKMELTNVKVLGFSETKITEVHSDLADGVFEINFIIPLAKCQGQYSANGVIALGSNRQKINARGDFEVSFTELSHHLTIKGGLQDCENGHKHAQIKSVNLLLEPQRMNLQFDNIFGNNSKKNELFHKKINENWSEIFRAVQPAIQESISEHIFKKLISNFFEAVPFNEILQVN